MCLLSFPVENGQFFCNKIALLLSCIRISSVALSPCAIQKYRNQVQFSILSPVDTTSVLVELIVITSPNFLATLIKAPLPIVVYIHTRTSFRVCMNRMQSINVNDCSFFCNAYYCRYKELRPPHIPHQPCQLLPIIFVRVFHPRAVCQWYPVACCMSNLEHLFSKAQVPSNEHNLP